MDATGNIAIQGNFVGPTTVLLAIVKSRNQRTPYSSGDNIVTTQSWRRNTSPSTKLEVIGDASVSGNLIMMPVNGHTEMWGLGQLIHI